jgi:DNA-binding response OmpR family regulator
MTLEPKPHILVVDDDESICKTLSSILQEEGYRTATATTAKEAIEKTRTEFFNIALLDIKLPDGEGTQLLSQLQEISPETMKIMVTGYPSLANAIEALNFGAASYIMKPVDPAELLRIIRDKIAIQQQAEKITREKLVKWTNSQTRKASSSSFQEFLANLAIDFTDFGLTKTQAKIYTTLVALGSGLASDIAALSRIRREEIYRAMSELEKRGIVTRILGAPRKFSAIRPEKAIENLTKAKLKAIKEEIDKLDQRKRQLISKLKAIELPVEKEDSSIGAVSQQDNLFAKLLEMTEHAKRQVDAIVPFKDLEHAYLSYPKHLNEKLHKTIKIRIITESHEQNELTEKITQCSETNRPQIELKEIEKLPFNILITDNNEAIWGEWQPNSKNVQSLWTNNRAQVSILKAAFENLWQNSRNPKGPNDKQ